MPPKSRNTLPTVPRQTRPQMVVRSFRIPAETWEKVAARCEREGVNPTEVVRQLVTEWAEDDGSVGGSA